MTDLQAAKILDPKTTLEAYAEAEYYGGFEGAKRWKEDVEEACIRGAKALRAEPERLQAELEREKTMHQHTAESAWAHEAELEKVKRERDAAIKDWKGFCAKCAWKGKQYLEDGQMDARCKTCRENGKCNWEWRGVKEDGQSNAR